MGRGSASERDLVYARTNEKLLDHLTHGEEIRVAARQHWWVLARPFAAAFAVTAFTGWTMVGANLPLGSQLPEYLLAITAGFWCFFGWQWLSRRHDILIVTDKRILKYQGIIVRDVPMMRISKITDMRYRKGLAGEIFGFGSITIESAGQDQALHDLDFIPDPLENYRRLCEVIFGDKHRPRKSSRDSWLGRAKRRVTRRKGRESMPSGPDDQDFDEDLDELNDTGDTGDDSVLPWAQPKRDPGARASHHAPEDPWATSPPAPMGQHEPVTIYRSGTYPDDPARTRALPIISPEELAREQRRQRGQRGQRRDSDG